MPEVIIDGVTYAPAEHSGPKAALAITTRNRNDILDESLQAWRANTPASWPIIVVDDASKAPVQGADYRFAENVGIATAKNKGLELAMATGAQHIFLANDDIQPATADWWRPYIDSPEPHLAHSWNLVKIYEDSQHEAFHASGGTLLYFTREVIEDVGGMRTIFGKYGCEHVNLSDRIHNRGWTTNRYQDVKGSADLFRELDRIDKSHKGVASPEAIEHNAGPGRELWMQMLDDDEYVEYRELGDVVITTLLTRTDDPQRGVRMRADVSQIKTLADSIKHGRLIVLHDELIDPKLKTGAGEPVEFVKVESSINPYFQRHVLAWQWLRAHPNVGRVWCVDGTDVRQLRDPFTWLEPGKIHLGWEPALVGNDWMRKNHPDGRAQKFIDQYGDRQLLNAGLIGGYRGEVMRFLHRLGRYYFDDHIDEIQKWETGRAGVGDMAALNMIAHTEWEGRIVTGTRVATIFKKNETDNGFSAWAHK